MATVTESDGSTTKYTYAANGLPATKIIYAGIIRDTSQLVHPFAGQRSNTVLGDSAQSESAQHNNGGIPDIPDGVIRSINDFFHRGKFFGPKNTIKNAFRPYPF